jgi:hypothetical protein
MPQHAVGQDGGDLDAEVGGARLHVRPACGEALLDELDAVGRLVLEQVLGDQAGDVDVEPDQLPLLVDKAKGRCLRGHAHEDLAPRQNLVELGLLLGRGRAGGHQARKGQHCDQSPEHFVSPLKKVDSIDHPYPRQRLTLSWPSRT